MKTTPETLLDHLLELRKRLMWVAGWFLLGNVIGFAAYKQIYAVLLSPLHGQKLIYTSPTGSVDFLLSICVSIGVLMAIPAMLYHVVSFLSPAITSKDFQHKIGRLVVSSLTLAAGGAAVAYFLYIPPSLHFFQHGFNTPQITPLVTSQSYLHFVLTYMVGFALLFQLPLLMLLINRIKPLKPSKLMRKQRYIIVGSLIVAIIMPTPPDPISQVLTALPMVGLYQVGVLLIWGVQLRQRRRVGRSLPAQLPIAAVQPAPTEAAVPAQPTVPALDLLPAPLVAHAQDARNNGAPLSVDGIISAPLRPPVKTPVERTAGYNRRPLLEVPARSAYKVAPRLRRGLIMDVQPQLFRSDATT